MKNLKSIVLIAIILFVWTISCAMSFQGDKHTKREHVSSFSTSMKYSSDNRKYNIKLATSHFSWLRVNAYDYLSFNQIVGERTIENGYKEAIVISYGEYKEGIGGGVCQVSSTLYNAWIRAGLSVKEVKNHSLPTSYVPLSQDATVSQNQDLVLYNDTNEVVVINGYVENDTIIFNIYAQKPDYVVNIQSKVIEEIMPPLHKVTYVKSFQDHAIYYEQGNPYIILKHEKKGYHSVAIKQIIRNGIIIKEEVIREDFYRPIQGEIGRLIDEQSVIVQKCN